MAPSKQKTKVKQPSILSQEIFSQPDVLARILQKEGRRINQVARAINSFDPQFVFLVARGSADNAGLYGKYLLGTFNRKVVALASPSIITRYGKTPDLSRALVVAISQSGESFDVVESVRAARAAGALTLAITNTAGSPLAQEAQEVLLCHAGPERSVAATKTYTAQLLLLAMLSTAMSGDLRRMTSLAQIPERTAEALQLDPVAREVAVRLRYLKQCVVIGRGYCYGTAFEVALKLAELTYMVAQPYSAADFRHGPMALVDHGFCVLLFCPKGRVLGDVQELFMELQKRGAEVIMFSDIKKLVQGATRGFKLPRGVPEWLAPLTAVIPGQLLAMHLCREKGLPLDTPRGLAKVTRTR